MGIGTARGDDRAVAAAEMAISSPLLEASIDGAHGVLLSIQGGSDLGLFEINEAAQLVANSAAPDANIIFGAVIDDALGDEVRVTVIAAGFDEPQAGRMRPRTTAYSGIRSAAEVAASGVAPATATSSDWRPFQLTGSKAPGAPAPSAPGTWELGAPRTSASRDATDNDAVDGSVTVEGIPAPRTGSSDGTDGAAGSDGFQNGARTSGAGRPSDSMGTRRKSVVFEEDDELDVPDFLK